MSGATPRASADLAAIADRLDRAAMSAAAVEQLAEPITLGEAYEVQRLSIESRLSRGERRLGVKMGVTSREKMAQVGITEVIWGRLTDAMLVENGGAVDLSRFIHPRAEPEIVFRLRAPLAGDVTELEAWSAIDGVAAGIEILDSRFTNFKFSITDVIADNASSSAVVIGPWNRPETDFANLGMSLEVNGRPVGAGSSAAILGHPIRSLVAGARLVAQRGESLQPGDIFLSGAATAAEPIRPGSHIRVRVQRLGQCSFSAPRPRNGG